jgi:hypothetical protein
MKEIKCKTLYLRVSERTFVILFYFGSGSKSGTAKAKVPEPKGS